MILLLHTAVIVLTAVGAWWLSSYDTQLSGDGTRADFIRRGVRTGITLLIVEVAFTNLMRLFLHMDSFGGYVYLALMVPLGITWAGCISELFARGFQRMVMPESRGPADLDASTRALDQVAALVQQGKKDEAIQLCRELQASGSVSASAMETMLAHLGDAPPEVDTGQLKKPKPVAEARDLRERGQAKEAETLLKSLLKKEPDHQEAALLLMQVYSQDMHEREKAEQVLQRITRQKHISPAYIEFAQRSIVEWSQPPAVQVSVPEVKREQSVDDLLRQGYIGTAIERLEQLIKDRPQDFVLQLKLVEAYAVYADNMARAGKVVTQIELNSAFTPEQKQQARASFDQWRTGQRPP